MTGVQKDVDGLPASLAEVGSLQGELPLCVDLDGVLILSNVLWESAVHLWGKPLTALKAVWGLRHGKTAMKSVLAEDLAIEPAALPYREDLLGFLLGQYDAGRRLVLVTSAHLSIAQRVADFLGIFSDVLATDEQVNLSGERKLQALVAAYGAGGFDYIGGRDRDLAAFQAARRSMLADPSRGLMAQVEKLGKVDKVFLRQRRWSTVIPRALLTRQWGKNLLLIVPLIAAHRVLDVGAWLSLGIAFICFGLLGSAMTLAGDLRDLEVDRKHQTKRFRPLASGDLPISCGIGLTVLLPMLGIWLAMALLPRLFLVSLWLYAVVALAYFFYLQSHLVIDALTLAMLYLIRIIAGAWVVHENPSNWLLMFSLFMFLSLALLERVIKLNEAADSKMIARGSYMPGDIDILHSMGAASGLMSVLVLGLYINSSVPAQSYLTPQLLWWLIPLTVYWVVRIWILANRRQVAQDPFDFVLTDGCSYVIGGMVGIVLLLATVDFGKLVAI